MVIFGSGLSSQLAESHLLIVSTWQGQRVRASPLVTLLIKSLIPSWGSHFHDLIISQSLHIQIQG